ncbi:MAG: ubiquinol-cytochrome C chaperone family protein [Janthinobacterium lividum]
MLGLFRRRPHERAAYTLYTEAVRAARQPYFYTELGVPDTLDGRFDLVGLHVFLLIDRLRAAEKPGPALAQAVFDAMFSDMDFNLREMGVGDMSVARRNKEMWEAFHGRSKAYEAAFAAGDDASLLETLNRNVWRGEAPGSAATTLAGMVSRLRTRLAETPLKEFVAGTVRFPAVAAEFA